MTPVEAVLSFAVVAGLLTITPGLDTALVLRSTVARSRAYGLSAALGIQVGTLAWGAAAATGAAALLVASQTAYRILTVAGAAYMIWLGVSMIARTLRRGHPLDEPVPTVPRGGLGRGFSLGLGTNLMNPKVGVFYVAMIPQFVPEGMSPLIMGLLLAAVHCVMGTTWLVLISFGASYVGARLRESAVVRWVDRVTGGVLIAFGARLAASVRT